MIFDNNYFFERVVNIKQKSRFLSFLCISGHHERRLNIIALASLICNEINLILFAESFAILVSSTMFNLSHIDLKSSNFKLIIDNVFHYMVFFLLPEVKIYLLIVIVYSKKNNIYAIILEYNIRDNFCMSQIFLKKDERFP